ncbi:4-hydroxyphenylpyruvate dioxygenase [Paucibacter sp. B2R-40]|uniref:4-hydroxyphenylpyruvate dioxygenase n=1 Tax=Paucibacter sp. B2R-40 TaxID=2893554 RepID=UPI0021E4F554|nr:4-hydroxyphenylpyruvate dioxygenase [Paucibacter sp. B2R-40]MCV2356401.1 4-hydroxyphenylpyruvate dioxygenase [Paucibacter sp. B2R-40]
MTNANNSANNPVGLTGIEFTEFCGPSLEHLDSLFWSFGFSKLRRHPSKAISYYRQNDIHFLLNGERDGHSAQFARKHGPAISAMGWRVENAQTALTAAVARGAVAVADAMKDHAYPAVWGIGESIIYFIEPAANGQTIYERDFVALDAPLIQADKGFLAVDHLTNNVPPGEQDKWANFYKNIFGFTEVRYFDIQGAKTGLTSFALRSPDGSFCIPINQPKDDKDQIAEYLREYKGPGVQHLAFSTHDILSSLDQLQGSGIETLEIDDDYYAEVFERVQGVREDHARLQAHQVLVDGDEQGYLLQIFTKNIIGPIFIEIIQRANNLGFGEGNFGALFRSLEKDQERRGVI